MHRRYEPPISPSIDGPMVVLAGVVALVAFFAVAPLVVAAAPPILWLPIMLAIGGYITLMWFALPPEAFSGSFAIHTIIVVVADVIMVTHPPQPPQIPPHVELVDVEVKEHLKPPPPPPVRKEEEKTPEPVKPAAPVRAARTIQRSAPEPPRPAEPPPPNTTESNPGGAEPVQMPDIAPDAIGRVPVAVGKRNTGPIGRGGSGTGTNNGDGSGAGAPVPVSVATIKTRAMPKGDYGYIDAGKDYPAEARQLGIEGPIRVRLIVDAEGKVKAAVLLNKLGHGLDELALDRAKKIEFDPAKDTDDKPVSSVVVWTFNMTLPK